MPGSIDPRLGLLGLGSLALLQRLPSLCDQTSPRTPGRRRVCVVGDSPAARLALLRIREHPQAKNTSIIWLPSSAGSHVSSALAKEELVDGRVEEVSGRRKTLRMADGREIQFDRCLLAMGRSKPSGDFYDNFIDREARHVYQCSEPQALPNLLRILSTGGHVTVIGSDWRAVELAASLAIASKSYHFANNISLVLNDFIMASTLPKYLSSALQKRLRARLGVEIIPMVQVQYVGGRTMVPSILQGGSNASLGIVFAYSSHLP